MGTLHENWELFVNHDTSRQTGSGDTRDYRDLIPAPVHKYTTTNPCTQSPTYHLIYDLTSHQTAAVPDPALKVNTSRDANQVFTEAYHNPPFTYTSSPDPRSHQENSGKSNNCDDPAAPVPGSTVHTNRLTQRTDIFNGKRNSAINLDLIVPSTNPRNISGPFKIHFSERSQAKQSDRPCGVDVNKRKIIGGFIDNNISTTSAAGTRHSAAGVVSTPENCALNAGSADAANISTFQESHLSLSSQKTLPGGKEIFGPTVDRLSYSTCVNSGFSCNCIGRTFNYTERQCDIPDGDKDVSEFHQLPEPAGVCRWDDYRTRSKDISDENANLQNKTSPYLNDRRENSNIETRKCAVFKLYGDSLRFFIVENDTQKHDFGDKEKFQNNAYVAKHPSQVTIFLNGDACSHTDSFPHISSKTRRRLRLGETKNTREQKNVSSCVLGENNSSKVNGTKIRKKPLNRWDNVEIRTRQTHASLHNADEQAIKLTTEKKSSSNSHHDKCLAKRNVPPRYRHTPPQEDKETLNKIENETLEPAGEGIFVNKSANCAGNELSEVGSGNDCVQFIDRTVTTVSAKDVPCSFSQFNYSLISRKLNQREVIDRAKYIIRRVNDHRDGNIHGHNVVHDGDCDSVLDTARESGSSNEVKAINLDAYSERPHSLTHFGLQTVVCNQNKRHCALVSTTRECSSDGVKQENGIGDSNLKIRENDDCNKNDLLFLNNFEQKLSPVVYSQKFSPEVSRFLFLDDCSIKSGCEQDSPSTSKARTENRLLSINSIQTNTPINCENLKVPENVHINDELSGEETLTYRNNLRDQCKRHHLLRLFNFDTDQNLAKETVLCKKATELRLSVSSLSDNVVGDQSCGSSIQNTSKITPRQKFEIRRNRLPEKVRTLAHCVDKDTATYKKELFGLTSSKHVKSYLSPHKESPRARFERDRAAKTHAVTRTSGVSCEKLGALRETVTCTLEHSKFGFNCSNQIKSFSWSCTDLSNTGCDKAGPRDKRKVSTVTEEDNHIQLQIHKANFLNSEYLDCAYNQVDSNFRDSNNRKLSSPNTSDKCDVSIAGSVVKESEDYCNPTDEGTVPTVLNRSEKSNTEKFSVLIPQENNCFCNEVISKISHFSQTNSTEVAIVACDTDIPSVSNFETKNAVSLQDYPDYSLTGHSLTNDVLNQGFHPKIHVLEESVSLVQQQQTLNPADVGNSCGYKNKTTQDLVSTSNKYHNHHPQLAVRVPQAERHSEYRETQSYQTYTSANCDSDATRSDPTNQIHCRNLSINLCKIPDTHNTSLSENKTCIKRHNEVKLPDCDCVFDTDSGNASQHEFRSHLQTQLCSQIQTKPCADIFAEDKKPGRHKPEFFNYVSTEHCSNCCDFSRSSRNSAGKAVTRVQANSTETNMLASKGLRIYESGEDFIAMMSPVKSPLVRSAPSSNLQWEGTTYLIVPTIVESAAVPSAASNSELAPQRSISDSGAPAHPGIDFRSTEIASDIHDDARVELLMSSRSRLNRNHRSMSVDVLCAEEADPESDWNNPRVITHKNETDSHESGRGYVEWRTCFSWVQNPTDMKNVNRRNSRGYVEWDTIWTTVAPWSSASKDDEHVYDVVAGNFPAKLFNENFEAKNGDLDMTDIPPALPERTYINRLKNNSSGSLSNKTSCSSTPLQYNRSNHHWHSHHHHHDSYNCRKHQHHYHHHYHNHHSNKHHKEHRSHTSSSTPVTNKTSSPSSCAQKLRQTSTSKSKSPGANGSTCHNSVSDISQNYAEVHKLKGYKFSNLMTCFDSATHDKSAIYSENYWHLAPVTSQDHVMSLQTGDVLDYIDGLHDSLSPKSRENIYLLLNNKQTRAKFSESLEIESRLLSKGLISGSNESKSSLGKMGAKDVKKKEASKDMASAGIRRKGASAPVSSTYV